MQAPGLDRIHHHFHHGLDAVWRGIDDDRVFGRPQRGDGSFLIPLVAQADLPQKVWEANTKSLGNQLFMSPAGAFLDARSEIDLERRIRKHDSAHVAAVRDETGRPPERALPLEHRFAYRRVGGKLRRTLSAAFVANQRAHLLPFEEHFEPLPARIALETHVQSAREPEQLIPIFEREAPAQRSQGEHPVDCTAVEEMEPEALCYLSAYRPLARADRTVHCDDRNGVAHGRISEIRRPRVAATSTNPGNEVSTLRQSSTLTRSRARSPAIANAIAMRWSPCEFTVPPESSPP